MFCSLTSIDDDTDHSMRQVRDMLEGLVDMGINLTPLTATLCHHEQGLSYVVQALGNRDRAGEAYQPIEHFIDNGFRSSIIKLTRHELDKLSMLDECILEQVFYHCGHQYTRKVVLVTGTDASSLKVFYLLK